MSGSCVVGGGERELWSEFGGRGRREEGERG